MLLTVQQKYILDILKKLPCLRAEQLRRLVAARFRHPDLETSRRRMSAMLRQLSTFQREVSLTEEFICYDGAQPDLRKLEALDVMLELTKDAPDDFTAQVKSPLQLRFLWGGDKLRLFTVISFSAVGVTGTYSERQRSERVIWISDNGAMPENLSLPSKHFFAVRQSDGSHRFYGSSEP